MSILMADRILSGSPMIDGSILPPVRYDATNLKNVIQKSQVFEMTNTSDYWWATDADKKWGAHELTNVRPPFDSIWAEVSNTNLPHDENQPPDRSAVHVFTGKPVSPRDAKIALEGLAKTEVSWLMPVDDWPEIHILVFHIIQSYKITNAWRRGLESIGIRNSDLVCQTLGASFMAILPNGKPCTALCSGGLGRVPDWITRPDQLQAFSEASEKAAAVKANEVFSVLFGLQFMHCKNVKVQENQPAPKLSKAFNRRHGRPLLSYKTLEIEPMKRVLESEGGIAQNGLKKALHICRGHFATYTPEKGMLGRKLDAPVTVWKPAHVRGDSSNGIVQKDYKVKAPA